MYSQRLTARSLPIGQWPVTMWLVDYALCVGWPDRLEAEFSICQSQHQERCLSTYHIAHKGTKCNTAINATFQLCSTTHWMTSTFNDTQSRHYSRILSSPASSRNISHILILPLANEEQLDKMYKQINFKHSNCTCNTWLQNSQSFINTMKN